MKADKKRWKKKYLLIVMIPLFILAAILYGVRNSGKNSKGGEILAEASPDTSAFQMERASANPIILNYTARWKQGYTGWWWKC